MIAAPATTLHLGADCTAEVYTASERWPACLRVSDGERWCSVDLTAVTWARLRATIEAAMEDGR